MVLNYPFVIYVFRSLRLRLITYFEFVFIYPRATKAAVLMISLSQHTSAYCYSISGWGRLSNVGDWCNIVLSISFYINISVLLWNEIEFPSCSHRPNRFSLLPGYKDIWRILVCQWNFVFDMICNSPLSRSVHIYLYIYYIPTSV